MTFTAPRSTQKARPPTIGFLRGAPHDVLTSSGTSNLPAERRSLDPQPLPRASSRLQRPTPGRPTWCKHQLDGSHGVSSRSTYQGASSRRSACAASGSRPEVPSPPSVSHAFRGLILDVRAALFHAADVLRVLPFEAFLLRPNVATLVVWGSLLDVTRSPPLPARSAPPSRASVGPEAAPPAQRYFTLRRGRCSPGRFLASQPSLRRESMRMATPR